MVELPRAKMVLLHMYHMLKDYTCWEEAYTRSRAVGKTDCSCKGRVSWAELCNQWHNQAPSACEEQPMDRSKPLHTQATHSDLDSEWALNLWPWHRRKRTWVFNYSLMLLSIKATKVRYINLAIDASMSVVSGWMKFTSRSGNYHGVNFNIYRANFIFVFMRSTNNMGSWQRRKFNTRNLSLSSAES